MGSISICRLCLNSERRTCLINNTVLQETLEKLTDVRFDTNDGRPLLACYVCCAQLRNSYRLRQRALKAQELFAKYVVNIDFEDSKKLVSLIVSKTHDVDYNHAFEEQYNFECMQKDPNAVEVKKEIKEEEDIDNKEFGKLFVYTYETVVAAEELKDEIKIPKEEIQGVTAKKYKAEVTKRKVKQVKINEVVEERKLPNTIADNNGTKANSNFKVFSCKTCGYLCSSKRSFNAHLRKHTGEKESLVRDLCDYRTFDSDILKRHRVVKHKEQGFSCHICPKLFSTRTDLNAHLCKHTGDKPYKCDLCDYRTTIKGNLKQHINCKHKEEKDYACHICEKKFTTKTLLNVHLRKHC